MFENHSVMILEDNLAIATCLELDLGDMGFGKIEVFTDRDSATRYLEETSPSCSILDFSLGPNDTSEQVARKLAAVGAPFLFLTGLGAEAPVPKSLRGYRTLAKPCDFHHLEEALSEVIALSEGPELAIAGMSSPCFWATDRGFL